VHKRADRVAAGTIAEPGVQDRLHEPFSVGSRDRLRPATFVLAGLTGVAATVATVVSTAEAQSATQLAVLGRGAAVAIPVAVALNACRAGPSPRFARLLLAAALLWCVVGLAESMHSLAYSFGRVAVWLVEPLVVYLVLAFPSGRLRSAQERAVVFASVTIVAVLYLPTALLVENYPVPAPWTSCATGCPSNAFMVSGSQPAFVAGVVQPVREILTQLVFLAAIVLLVRRMRGASVLMRRLQDAVLAMAIVRFATITTYLLERRAGVTGAGFDALGWIWLLTLPGMALAFFFGMFRWRLFVAQALQRVTLSQGLTEGRLRDVLAAAFDDQSLRILYRVSSDRDDWVAENGEPAQLPAPDSGLDVTEIAGADDQVVAIVHDSALSDSRDVVHAAAAHVLRARDNQELMAQVKRSLRELAESRARVVAAGDSERRKIEQNLHDGAQQRLIALLIRLEQADEQIGRDPLQGRQFVQNLAAQVELAIEEIRALARGIYPPALTDFGLARALRDTAAKAPLPTVLNAHGIGRYSRELEACVYFTCVEALQNAHKHARGAKAISITLTEGQTLDFEVRDDGAGFNRTAASPGAGIVSMEDRVGAMGGRVTIESGFAGTRVAGSLPLYGTGGR
jgi:signal transduction histidine kinase